MVHAARLLTHNYWLQAAAGVGQQTHQLTNQATKQPPNHPRMAAALRVVGWMAAAAAARRGAVTAAVAVHGSVLPAASAAAAAAASARSYSLLVARSLTAALPRAAAPVATMASAAAINVDMDDGGGGGRGERRPRFSREGGSGDRERRPRFDSEGRSGGGDRERRPVSSFRRDDSGGSGDRERRPGSSFRRSDGGSGGGYRERRPSPAFGGEDRHSGGDRSERRATPAVRGSDFDRERRARPAFGSTSSDRRAVSGERGGSEGGRFEPTRSFTPRPAAPLTPSIPPATAASTATTEESAEPEVVGGEQQRIAKRIAAAGVASRREAEALIAAGKVRLNGAVVTTPATFVTADDDVVVDGTRLPRPRGAELFLVHKLRNELVTRVDPQGRPTLPDRLASMGLPANLITVGRLDFGSEGLLLATTNGPIAQLLERPGSLPAVGAAGVGGRTGAAAIDGVHPTRGLARVYKVKVYGRHVDRAMAALGAGITIDGVTYAPARVRLLAERTKQRGGGGDSDDDVGFDDGGDADSDGAASTTTLPDRDRDRDRVRDAEDGPPRLAWLEMTLYEGKVRLRW